MDEILNVKAEGVGVGVCVNLSEHTRNQLITRWRAKTRFDFHGTLAQQAVWNASSVGGVEGMQCQVPVYECHAVVEIHLVCGGYNHTRVLQESSLDPLFSMSECLLGTW